MFLLVKRLYSGRIKEGENMLVNEYMKVKNSEIIKKLKTENEKLGELIAENNEDFTPIFLRFFSN